MSTNIKAFGMSSYCSNAMKSQNPNSGIYEAETSRTLDNNGGNPACNQGGIIIVCGIDGQNSLPTYDKACTLLCQKTDYKNVPSVLMIFEGNGSRPSHRGDGFLIGENMMYTLNSTEVHGVAYEKNSTGDS